MDLYQTSQAEKTELSQDFLIEVSFQVLKALEFIQLQNDSTQVGIKGMLRMSNILFDQFGLVKIQDMSNVYFQEYQIRNADLIFLPPEILKSTKDKYSSNIDVWTLGMILLNCICLQFRLDEEMQNLKA